MEVVRRGFNFSRIPRAKLLPFVGQLISLRDPEMLARRHKQHSIGPC